MLLPGVNTRTVADLVPEVIDYLQGRTDVSVSLASRYLKRAIQEVTESESFEELKVTGPQVSLVIGQTDYPVSQFLNNQDDYTHPESMAIFVDFPANTITQPVKYRVPAALEQMTSPATQGIPAWYTRYGINFRFGPTPNNPYVVFLRYQRRHPFPDDPAAISGQQLMIPDTWEEIVSISAALRIATVKRWNDQKQVLHDLLYGDPEFMASEGKRGRPGVISARRLQVERDQMFNTRQVGIVVQRYNPR